MGLGWNWGGIGRELGWNGGGTGAEWERSGSGTGVEFGWNGGGTGALLEVLQGWARYFWTYFGVDRADPTEFMAAGMGGFRTFLNEQLTLVFVILNDLMGNPKKVGFRSHFIAFGINWEPQCFCLTMFWLRPTVFPFAAQ